MDYFKPLNKQTKADPVSLIIQAANDFQKNSSIVAKFKAEQPRVYYNRVCKN